MSKTEQTEREIKVYSISKFIKIVAVQGGARFDWAAYAVAVPGEHAEEWKLYEEYGDKIRRNLAEFLFPDFAEKYQWRP